MGKSDMRIFQIPNDKQPNLLNARGAFRGACGRGFTMVELLVVMAIIGLLLAVLLPALSRARDAARQVVCLSQQRQIFTLSEAFRADTGIILPAWYYSTYPTGMPQKLAARYGSGYPNYNELGMVLHYGWLLWRYSYVGANWVYKDTTPPLDSLNAADINKTFANTFKGIFACPSAAGPYVRGDILGANRTGAYHRAELEFQNGYNYGYVSNYMINRHAGSSWQYLYNSRENYEFYPVRRWKNSPDKIGYLFENNHKWVEELHFISDRKSPGGGAWFTQYYPKYNPTAPHNGLTKANMILADGHGVVIGDKYNTAGEPTWPYLWY